MSGPPERLAPNERLARWRRSAALGVLLLGTLLVAPYAHAGQDVRDDRHRRGRLDEASRREGVALVGLVDAATTGRVASDFSLGWRNDFFKAQTGTFVPFTVTVPPAQLSAATALMYVRATRRDSALPVERFGQVRYPFELIFPVQIGTQDEPVRITRGFAVPPGEYDVYVALRERAPDLLASEPRLKAAVLKQPLSVPDFWGGELATSSVVLADRIEPLLEAPAADDALERPYVIGESEIHPAQGSAFSQSRELIVVFLIYNAMVSADRNFDIQVDYHLFRTMVKGAGQGAASEREPPDDHPAARAGERYITHTAPQRFKPAMMDARFDPRAGDPVMAGQGILLSSFEAGEYRLGITVTDLLSRKVVLRDVTFTVVGS
jgi:hypothetical protein